MKINTTVHAENAAETKEFVCEIENLKQENEILKAELEELKLANQLLQERLSSHKGTDHPIGILDDFAVVLQGLLPLNSEDDNEEGVSLFGLIEKAESELAGHLHTDGNPGSRYVSEFLGQLWEEGEKAGGEDKKLSSCNESTSEDKEKREGTKGFD
ncbi:hypothetical protein D3H55_13830 [Bacillus salacetis]|uniref:Uncharacterized protein n=1 Tax=Bacillus salacetis TaxID=2315464 RepID=A0A3A1QVH4_9BACI|nr:hypothetical protein [Bacillus salacetis]RIW32343.1 hypothetical protein D3H55_13830 [Bacillus salacetis]